MTFRVASIGDRAFYKCASLVEVNIPESITKIGLEAFLGCESLTHTCTQVCLAHKFAQKGVLRVTTLYR